MKRIPTKLKVVLKPEKTITRTVLGREEKATVRPAFVVPADSAEMLDLAFAWAHGYSKTGYKNAKDRGWVRGEDPEVIEIANDTFTDLQLWQIWHRGHGGVAYEVITSQGWFVDLREEEFLDAVLHFGMGKGGQIKGMFQWVRSGTSQMRIAYVGSKLYCECEEDDKMRANKPISKGDLEVGGVYKGNFTNEQVYLGRVRYKGKVLQAWIALITHEYYLKRAGLTPEDRQGQFDYGQRCSPHVQIVKEKKVLEKVANIRATKIRISCAKGWSGGRIEEKEVEGIDLPVED
jgi:hypothetical protein